MRKRLNMKACLLLRAWVLGLVLAPCFAHAQNQISPAVYTYNDPGSSISCNVPLNEINIHAYRHFHRLFPTGTTGEYWFKSAEGYQVSFVQDAQRHQAYFDLRGAYLYSLKYYAGAKMPAGSMSISPLLAETVEIFCVRNVMSAPPEPSPVTVRP